MYDLSRRLSFSHRFSVSYAPWANSGAETLNRVMWKYLKAVNSQFENSNWKQLLPLVEVNINNAANHERCGFTPNQLFSGMRSDGRFVLGKKRVAIKAPDAVIKLCGENWWGLGNKKEPLNQDSVLSAVESLRKGFMEIDTKVTTKLKNRQSQQRIRHNLTVKMDEIHWKRM